MLNFEKDSSIEVKFDGEIYKLKYPKIRRFQKFRKDTRDSLLGKIEKDDIDLSLEYLEDLGMDKNVTELLTLSQLNTLLKSINKDFEEQKKS